MTQLNLSYEEIELLHRALLQMMTISLKVKDRMTFENLLEKLRKAYDPHR